MSKHDEEYINGVPVSWLAAKMEQQRGQARKRPSKSALVIELGMSCILAGYFLLAVLGLVDTSFITAPVVYAFSLHSDADKATALHRFLAWLATNQAFCLLFFLLALTNIENLRNPASLDSFWFRYWHGRSMVFGLLAILITIAVMEMGRRG